MSEDFDRAFAFAFAFEVVCLVLAGVAFGFVVGGLLLMTGVSL